MKIGGAIVSLIAGLFGVVMAFITLGIGGLGGALGGEGAETVIGLGWAGIFLTFAIIVFAVLSIFAKSKLPSVAVIILAIITAIAGGTLVAIFMVLALVGGVLTLIGVSKEKNIRRQFKMKNTSWLSIVSIIVLTFFILLALGSGEDSDVDRGVNDEEREQDDMEAEPDDTEAEPDDNDINKYVIREEFTVNGLKIIIGEIEVRQRKVLVGLTLRNEIDRTLTFYPDQGEVVMGAMQMDSNMFMTEGDVSGDIRPGVEKSGVIHFTTPEDKDVPDEDNITLYLGNVFDEETFETGEFIESFSLQ